LKNAVSISLESISVDRVTERSNKWAQFLLDKIKVDKSVRGEIYL